MSQFMNNAYELKVTGMVSACTCLSHNGRFISALITPVQRSINNSLRTDKQQKQTHKKIATRTAKTTNE